MPSTAQTENIDGASLLRDLRALGIAPGATLCVHSSLSRIGSAADGGAAQGRAVVGGAEAVVAALMETVGPTGALMLPHFQLTPALPVSDEDRALGIAWKVRYLPYGDRLSRTGMGRIADTFARRTDVAYGPQRVHTTVAWGARAGWLCQGWRHLLAARGRVLLLGVQMDRCSILHLIEERVTLAPDLARRVYPALPEKVAALYPPVEWALGMAGSGLDLLEVQRAARAEGLLRFGRVGAAQAILLDPAPVLDLFERLLRADPSRLMFPAG
jgi:aminoglycoside 3-N-acetyltransferase